MASNTPPIRVYKSTAAKIAETVIPERVIVSDPVNHVTVIGDGVTKGGVSFGSGSSEPSTCFYDGTKEQFDADPNAPAILKGIAGDGLLFVVPDSVVNPDGTFDEAALKEWLEANYLQLTGGTLTGYLHLFRLTYQKQDTADVSRTDALPSRVYNQFFFTDANDFTYGELDVIQETNLAVVAQLKATNKKADGTSVSSAFGAVVLKDGTTYSTVNTPAENAPNNAVQTRESVTRDFLPKTGGEIINASPVLNLRATALDATNIGDTSQFTGIIKFSDKNNSLLGDVYNSIDAEGKIYTTLNARSIDKHRAYLAAVLEADGTGYCTCSEPRGLYTNEIATFRSLVDYTAETLKANLDIYIDAINGSDTADLHNGRGLSASKPFKTINSCLGYIKRYYRGSFVCDLQLLSDITEDNFGLFLPVNTQIRINGSGGIRTINFRVVSCYSGTLLFGDNLALNINNSGGSGILCVGQNSNMQFVKAMTINGSAQTLVTCIQNGYVDISNSMTLTGNFSGRRYYCGTGGIINSHGKGVNALPGTAAGTVEDSASFYI